MTRNHLLDHSRDSRVRNRLSNESSEPRKSTKYKKRSSEKSKVRRCHIEDGDFEYGILTVVLE